MTTDKTLEKIAANGAKQGKVAKVLEDTGTFEITPQNTHAYWQKYLDELAPGKFILDGVGVIQGGGTRLSFVKVGGDK